MLEGVGQKEKEGDLRGGSCVYWRRTCRRLVWQSRVPGIGWEGGGWSAVETSNPTDSVFSTSKGWGQLPPSTCLLYRVLVSCPLQGSSEGHKQKNRSLFSFCVQTGQIHADIDSSAWDPRGSFCWTNRAAHERSPSQYQPLFPAVLQLFPGNVII